MNLTDEEKLVILSYPTEGDSTIGKDIFYSGLIPHQAASDLGFALGCKMSKFLAIKAAFAVVGNDRKIVERYMNEVEK